MSVPLAPSVLSLKPELPAKGARVAPGSRGHAEMPLKERRLDLSGGDEFSVICQSPLRTGSGELRLKQRAEKGVMR